MRNRAKCKLCNDLIESTHHHDYVTCKCGEISIDGGNTSGYVRRRANDYKNFLHIDDDGTEIDVEQIDRDEKMHAPKLLPEPTMPSRGELVDMLDEMRKHIESLPPHALYAPVSNADHCSLIILLLSIFKS